MLSRGSIFNKAVHLESIKCPNSFKNDLTETGISVKKLLNKISKCVKIFRHICFKRTETYFEKI